MSHVQPFFISINMFSHTIVPCQTFLKNRTGMVLLHPANKSFLKKLFEYYRIYNTSG